ncbi:hypothetical protein [Lignipirellula cremea]|uniref:hypothetical protein n=1 Tax=Lignipirellula cremea TaxID=2528010 RepID=UPI0011AA02BD|nr:hypothetical protein [Lignipirellula cremea]
MLAKRNCFPAAGQCLAASLAKISGKCTKQWSIYGRICRGIAGGILCRRGHCSFSFDDRYSPAAAEDWSSGKVFSKIPETTCATNLPPAMGGNLDKTC